jgi:transcriptional regulator with XRE-family HTH domain
MPPLNNRVLRGWRFDSGMTPEEVCWHARPLSTGYLRELEDGRATNPSAPLLARIAAAYGRSLDELFTADDDTEPAGAA